MTMRRSTQPPKASGPSTSLSLPPWNRSNHPTAPPPGKGADVQRKQQRSPTNPSKHPTSASQKAPPPPTPRTPQQPSPEEGMQSPNAYELMTMHTHEGGGIYSTFLGNDQHYGPVVPQWAENQCTASCLDVDTDTQLHQLMLRVAATRDLLRNSASQATTHEMRRVMAKGQSTNHGVIRYDVRSSGNKTGGNKQQTQGGEAEGCDDWQPPQVLIRFPWEAAGGAASHADAEVTKEAVMVPLEQEVTEGRGPSRSINSAYHRYFCGAREGSGPATTGENLHASSKHRRTHEGSATEEVEDSHQKGVKPTTRHDDGAAVTSSTHQRKHRRPFDPQTYAQMILHRSTHALHVDETTDDHESTAIDDDAQSRHRTTHPRASVKPHHSSTLLLSPPRDDDGPSEVFFDSLAQRAPPSRQVDASVDMLRPAVDNGLVETPRGDTQRSRHAVPPVVASRPPQPHDDGASENGTAATAGLQQATRSSAFWAPSAAVAFECINFAATANPVFVRMPGNGSSSRTTSVSQSGGSMMVDDMLRLLAPYPQ